MSSDHIPIIVEIRQHTYTEESMKKSYRNFSKANWEDFKEYIEAILENGQVQSDVHQGERTLLVKITAAVKRFNPAGIIKEICKNFPTHERHAHRQSNRAYPNIPLLQSQEDGERPYTKPIA